MNKRIITDVVVAENALHRHNIPVHEWRGGSTNTLDKFKESIEKHNIWLIEDKTGLSLHVTVAVVHVIMFKEKRWQILYEDFVYCPKTKVRKSRNGTFSGSIAGKPNRSECILDAAHRELNEELGYTEPRFKDRSHYDLVSKFAEIVQRVDWYPGLPEIFHRYHFLCVPHPDLYRQRYIERDPDTGRIIAFTWRDIIDQNYPDKIKQTPGSTLVEFDDYRC